MFGIIGDIKKYNLNIIKDGETIYTGSSDNLPDDLKEVHYNSIKFDKGALTIEI